MLAPHADEIVVSLLVINCVLLVLDAWSLASVRLVLLALELVLDFLIAVDGAVVLVLLRLVDCFEAAYWVDDFRRLLVESLNCHLLIDGRPYRVLFGGRLFRWLSALLRFQV